MQPLKKEKREEGEEARKKDEPIGEPHPLRQNKKNGSGGLSDASALDV